MRLVLIAVAVIAAVELEGQSPKSLEICGVQFRVGMSYEQVREKLTGREELKDIWLEKSGFSFAPALFGKPVESSGCSGYIRFENGKVNLIEKTLFYTTDAAALANFFFRL